MKLLFLWVSLLALALAQQNLVDDWLLAQTVTATAANPTISETVMGPNIIGGTRTLRAQRVVGSDPSLETQCSIVDGFFALSNDVSVQGNCLATYAGPTGTGFTPVNFLQNGCECWNIKVIQTDNDVSVEFQAESTLQATPLISRFDIPVDIAPPGIDICLPYGGERSAYQSIDMLSIAIIGNAGNVDARLNFSCCQPPVSCVHTITGVGGADIDNLFTGDRIKITTTCTNYDSMPASLEDIVVTFPFPPEFGIFDAGSLMCNSPLAFGEEITPGNMLRFNGSLVENENATCMAEVDLIAPGMVDDLTAFITTRTNTDFPFNSNRDVDRQGTEAFCEPPVPSSLIIQLPPTTLPPTTAPPTTAPPTTEPPTTEPPTTEPPTTEPPTTEPPTTEPPTTEPPTTEPPTTEPPTTEPPTTEPPTTEPPTTEPPTTEPPTTEPPTTAPPTTEPPTTEPPTTEPPTTEPPTTEPPTTEPPTTAPPTTAPPTTEPPTTEPPTTEPPTTEPPTTEPPTTAPPTTEPPTTEPPTTEPPTTAPPTTEPPTTEPPTTEPPTTLPPITQPPTTEPPTTEPPTTEPPTTAPPTTEPPTTEPPTTEPPTTEPPTTEPPTTEPPTTAPPTTEPPTTEPPTTEPPTTMTPVTQPPTTAPPTTEPPTTEPPTTEPPTTEPPTTEPPTTEPPTTEPPTTEPPTTEPPTTEPPTTEPPTTLPPTTEPPTTAPPTTLPPTTLPPTTSPPTTLPPTTVSPTVNPTTLPPTTEPPTTLPPTTSPPQPPRFICVAPLIVDGECVCNTFPCFEIEGTRNLNCQADEWYCWYIVSVPPSGRFRVSYRGQMCYCTV